MDHSDEKHPRIGGSGAAHTCPVWAVCLTPEADYFIGRGLSGTPPDKAGRAPYARRPEKEVDVFDAGTKSKTTKKRK